MSASKQKELLEALKWALPLAELAMEQHRQNRLQAGHSDMRYVTARGVQCVGLYQVEWDQVEHAHRILADAVTESASANNKGNEQ